MPEIDLAAALHAARHAADGPDPLTPSAIGAAAEAHTHTPWVEVRTSGGQDLNTFTVPGVYMVNQTVANAPTSGVGFVRVTARPNAGSNYLMQEYTTTTAANNSASAERWLRHSLTGETWSSWTPLHVPLDTGWRYFDYLSNSNVIVEGSRCLIRRMGHQVFCSWQASWTGSGAVAWNAAIIPVGFRPSANGNRLDAVEVTNNGGRSAGAGFGVNSSGSVRLDADGPGTGGASLAYFTTNSWPTTLPGTPV